MELPLALTGQVLALAGIAAIPPSGSGLQAASVHVGPLQRVLSDDWRRARRDLRVAREACGAAPTLTASAAAGWVWPDGRAPGIVQVVDAREVGRRRASQCPDRCPTFGAAFAWFPEVNGDRLPELLVGDPECSLAAEGGAVFVLSGADCGELARFEARLGHAWGGWSWGHTIVVLPDRTGDGVPEVGVGAPAADSVGIVSGGDWRALATVEAPGGTNGWLSEFGAALARVPDLDGDGAGDYVVSAPEWSYGKRPGRLQECGRMWLLSGSDDRVLASWRGSEAFAEAGRALAIEPIAPGRIRVLFSEREGFFAVELRSGGAK